MRMIHHCSVPLIFSLSIPFSYSVIMLHDSSPLSSSLHDPVRVMATLPTSVHVMPVVPSLLPDEKRKAVVLCKGTRWQYEGRRMGENGSIVSDCELERLLLERNIDPLPLKLKDEEQRKVEETIVNQLRENGMSVTLCHLSSLPSRLPPLSLVVTVGGDGTFLSAAALVVDSTPVVGINSDPMGSEGHLCVGGKNRPKDLIRMLVDKDTKWTTRSRIKVTIYGGKNAHPEPLLALNEVFVGEKDSAKVSYYDISIDGGPAQRQKSSGFIASSASGSSAWYSSINRVLPDTVTDVMETLRSMGISIPIDASIPDRIANHLNDSLIKSPSSDDLLFSVREPIFNKTFAPSPVKGKARRINLRSRCSNANLVLDGSRHFDFDYGSVISLEIDPDYALTTLI
ncbi:hypothetical protein PENTCL1PPCAC_17990 [Pristionchus entomophagus]|uniref:NAD(+) kinase n=1 Tax=Pristionchus entomophagus TaxID=358040 RepID=A0AAV5TN55_9BILA|nr:hypothetical protein PENTCL1PPCAC_17990 [Pristionchus entomophagus]